MSIERVAITLYLIDYLQGEVMPSGTIDDDDKDVPTTKGVIHESN